MKSKRLIFFFALFALLLSIVFFTVFSYGKRHKPKDDCTDGTETFDDGPHYASEETKTVTLIMVGDLLMHETVQKSGLKSSGEYDFSHLFKNVKKEISSADIAIINQETPLAGKKFGLSGYPLFNAPTEVADAIADAGFDVILQATNHALDKGKAALIYCREYYEKNYPHLCVTGTYISEEQSKEITVVERNGIKVAILNYTYGTNGIPLPKDMPYAVNLLDESKVRADIKKAKKVADFVVVCPHWGIEYTHNPSKEQRKWCEIFLECGVDLVIGTHPHVIQPIEWYEGENGHKMLVYYSLGNFVNSAAVSGNGISVRMLGAMAKVTLARNENGKVEIQKSSVLPLVTHLNSGFGGITTYLFEDYTEALAEENFLLKERDPKFSYQYCQKVFNEVFGYLFD